MFTIDQNEITISGKLVVAVGGKCFEFCLPKVAGMECDATGNPLALQCCHADDFGSVLWYGETFFFTPQQALGIKRLWRAWQSPLPDVHQSEILAAAECGEQRLKRLLGKTKAWERMIHHSSDFGGRVGYYRLAPPPGKRVQTEQGEATELETVGEGLQ